MLRSQKRLKSRGFLRLYWLRVASKGFIYFLKISIYLVFSFSFSFPLALQIYFNFFSFPQSINFALINNDIHIEITLNNNYLRFS